MRGDADRQLPLFHTFEVEDRTRKDHPLRDIKRRVDRILDTLYGRFTKLATIGTDKGFDSGLFYLELEQRRIEPHGVMIQQRLRHPGEVKPKERAGAEARARMDQQSQTHACALSQQCRKKVEVCFGWLKSVAGLDRCKTVGRWKLRQSLEVGAAAFNFLKMIKHVPVA